MAPRHQVIPRTLCFVFFEDEILLMKAGSNKKWKDIYNPLGGHVEKGESVIDSAHREIKEECGLDVKNTKLKGIIHSFNFFGKDVMLFITTSSAESKKVVSNDEGTLHWVKKEQLDNLKTLEDMKPIMEKIFEVKPDEMFFGTTEYDGKDKLLSLDIKIS